MECKKSFVFGQKDKKLEIVRRHLEDSSSYRTIQKRNRLTKNTACKTVNEAAQTIKDSFWVARNLKPKWGGILVFDGTYIRVKNQFAKLARRLGWYQDERFLHKMIVLLGVDFHTRDLPHYSLGDNENMIDLVMYFQQLKENGYDTKILVRDGNQRISKAAEHVYGRPIITQLCHYHFLSKFDEKIACKELLAERQFITELKNRICSIIYASDIGLACKRMNDFMVNQNQFRISKTMNELSDKFIRDFEQLTMYLQYPKGYVPRTSNMVEGMNRQLKGRLRSMCGFESISSAENYIRLWCLKRRFQKFTDCKKPYQNFNGRAPLEIAGCSISKLDYLKL
ncbi:transposase [Candidatus Gracilibacteria bacterium]|nr:transposase [Candidatus Gracilibacteria bacterium]